VQDRRHERTLRIAQAKHRLDEAFELVSNEIERVQADALFLSDQIPVREFVAGDKARLEGIAAEYASFLRRKQIYDHIRLLDLKGLETIRVNYSRGQANTVASSDLQDKSDRYYFRKALSLQPGDVFVSDFDLNLEHGQIEKPLKPVIRFVAPIVDDLGATKGLLVLNYLGDRLLRKIGESTVPGLTMILRTDGNYILGPSENDGWGWLLGHGRSFVNQFPHEWANLPDKEDGEFTQNGLFARRNILLDGTSAVQHDDSKNDTAGHETIIVVSYLPRHQIFEDSNKSLTRLLWVAGCVLIPVAIFSRYWAHASLSRKLQADQIAVSECRLRELSSRLLRIQEDERRSISRQIHDELGQQVTAINLDLKLANRNIESGNARSHLERAIRENEELLQTLHTFATRVRPVVLDDLGLRDAIESHLWDFQERTKIEVDAILRFQSADIPDEVADNAYRLIQESLNNVAKHAHASKVDVVMTTTEEDCLRFIRITIRDDGRGYGVKNSSGQRLGLVGMQERVDLLSGTLNIESRTHEGTSIDIKLPLNNGPADKSEQQL
jgi:signal transduction histidine kinase